MYTGKKNIFFDLDHTLWNFEKNSAIAFEAIFKKLGINISHSSFNKCYSPVNARYWKLYRDGEISREELRYGRLRDTFLELNYHAEDDLLHVISEEYINLLPVYTHLHDGTLELLDYLKEKYTLHIITNGPDKVQQLKMQNAGIDHYFRTITNSDIAGCKKPDSRIFDYALAAAGAEKHESVMIGDCIEADVKGAMNCGIDAIFYNEHKQDTDPSIYQVFHLLDLKKIF